jgi:murein DD-endopeptidase MepM/ murein hydrolase activator NlpD
MNVQSFVNDFRFQLTNANADGFTFTIQGIGPTALGARGGGLGYTNIGTNSVAVGFQLYSSVLGNKEVSLTGDWTNGAAPDSTPGTDTTGSGVDLHSGDVMSVHMTYDGTTLTWTITDTTTGKTFTKSVAINIPALTGNTAYVGFTGGDGGLTAVQDILTWTYTPGSNVPVAPSIATQPANQTVTVGQTATFSVVASGTAPFTYQWLQNTGSGFTAISGANSSSYTTPVTTSNNDGNTFEVMVTNSVNSVTSNTVTLTVTAAPSTPSYGSGLTTAGIAMNGGAAIAGSARLRLTDGGGSEGRSAFFITPVNVQSFISTFTFQLTNANADGFTFTIQPNSATALGSRGGGLGYAGILQSVAVGFQLYSGASGAVSLVGLWTNGASPDATPGTDMSGSSINLHSGDTFKVIISYNGTTLSMYIRDLTNTNLHFFKSFPINIPSTVGSNTAFVGFTGGDGGLTATQDILSWSYSNSTGSSGTFIWPVDPPAVVGSSDYSTVAFGGQYHTGLDLCPGTAGCLRGDPVYATADGTVQGVFVTSDPAQTMCDGSTTGSLAHDNNHLGNTIIIAHSNGKFSLYGNMDCVWPGIAPGVAVRQGARIGNIGNSQYGVRFNTWTPHVHFEIKDAGVVGDPATGAFASFTPDLPDGYGYHDPRLYLFPSSQSSSMSATAVKVLGSPSLNVLTGPDTSYSSLSYVTTGQEFVAHASSGSWYQIDLPNSQGPISGWIPASAGSLILAAPDSAATKIQVTNSGSAGLLIRPSASAATNLVSFDNNSGFVPNPSPDCTSTIAKIWDGQFFVTFANQNGFDEFYLPLNYYFSSANACAQPSGPGSSVGWASSTSLQ